MNIYAVHAGGEWYGVAAKSKDEAIDAVVKDYDGDAPQIDEAYEVPRADWDKRKIIFTDETDKNGKPLECTYTEYMDGDWIKETTIICSTEWL